ncbi:putative ABC transporter ATP-binding protein YbbL [Chryseobacterium oranimense G311]|uniref:AAA family ATPase n=1 Tax=Chryseobacterium oranimense TaxID=421058 RepID=UPI0005337299|nr:AAA family ATPase [Chryseobacterium oranimense]CEJ71544.1 putative ABC transporter ATP-binding protein YbbL [Chryseobacterium oranimense G311]
MIKLEQQRPYLSLNSNENYELEDFSIITGINGSGKTHLLKAINDGIILIEGINQSAITYYNYNDFSLFYDDPATNPNVKEKEDFFINKSSNFQQDLDIQRKKTLDSYEIWNESLLIEERFIKSNGTVFESLDWSDKEIETFESNLLKAIEEGETHITLPNSNHNQKNILVGPLGENNKNFNASRWLEELKIAIIKNHIIHLLKNNNYNSQVTKWDDADLERFQSLKKEDPNFTITPFDNSNWELSNNFIGFFFTINSLHLNQFEKENNLEKLREYYIVIYDDIKKHFKKNSPKDYFEFALLNNGKQNLLNTINVDHGFLNLQVIADEEKQYQIGKIQNEYNQFKRSKDNSTRAYTDEDFLKHYTLSSPVKLLNDVLNEYDCNGYVFRESQIEVDFMNGVRRQNISISLFNKKDNYSTDLDSLSSGEKTLIALSFYLFKLRKNKVITRLLLLDEIDSALHPSMSKRLLDVLYNIFHRKMGIKIIISSHSPSTVALAPTDSIYVMDKYSTPKISKASKDKALKELTIGVPSFSVNFENRRQVFVESEYDANYYESLYNIYNNKLNPEISLNFISSGKTKINGNGIGMASCDQVVSIVNILRKAGNNFSWGIIDWDLKNKSSDFIKVLGGYQRYSIENYLLDPLLLAILLWKEDILKAEYFGFEKDEVYFNILNFNQSQLQQVVDKIISDLQINLKNDNLSESINYTLCNGITLQIPTWYCKTQGHLLEDIIMKTYPQLDTIRKKDESALKKAVINKVILNFKDLTSIDLLNIFRSIQED